MNLRSTSSLAVLLGITACGKPSPKHLDLGVDASVDLSMSMPQTQTWSGTVSALDLTDAGMVPDGGLATIDASICLIETQQCQEGSSQFSFELPLPTVGASAAYGAAITSIGYFGQTIFAGLSTRMNSIGIDTTFVEEGGPNLMTDEQATAYLGNGGIAYPSTTTGYVQVLLRDPTKGGAPGLAGGTATINGATKTVYEDANGDLDPSLTSTSSSGFVILAGVAPGAFTVHVNVPGKTCNAIYDYYFPNTGTNSMGAEVAVGTMTQVLEFNCL